MVISIDLETKILRLYHAEKWPTGTIARQLGVHRGTVARVLAQAGLPRHGPPTRASLIDPYLPFIHESLEKFPSLTASRLFGMVRTLTSNCTFVPSDFGMRGDNASFPSVPRTPVQGPKGRERRRRRDPE